MRTKLKMDGAETIGNRQSKFSIVPRVAEDADVSRFDNLLIKAGAKEMAGTPKTSSPLEWNKSVLGLAATIVALVVILAGVVWNYAALSTNFENEKKERQRLEKSLDEVKTRMSEIERRQYQSDLMQERINGFKAGVAETQSKEK